MKKQVGSWFRTSGRKGRPDLRDDFISEWRPEASSRAFEESNRPLRPLRPLRPDVLNK